MRSRVVGALEVAAKTNNLLERDRLSRFVVVGGNFTGVELAGELQAFLRSILRYYPSIDSATVEVVVVESSDKLLGHLPEKFGKYAASVLRARGTRLLLGQDVKAVDSRGVELKDGERIESATVVWAAGVEPSPLAKQLGIKTNKHGAIETGGDFAVTGTPHVWALGDCAAVPRPEGGTYAPLAENAIREGELLAANIRASLRRKPTKNFRYHELGQMASLGDRNAVVELPGGRMLTGTVAWMAWRTYYLARLPGWNTPDAGRTRLDARAGLSTRDGALTARTVRACRHLRTSMRLADKVVIVTGGDSGIGKAIRSRWRAKGRASMIDYVGDDAPATALVEQIETSAGRRCLAADVVERTKSSLRATVRHFGGVDILVNNAGIERRCRFSKRRSNLANKVLSIQPYRRVALFASAAKHMVKQKRGGRIINISSVHEEQAMPTNAPYCASKGGVRMLMRTIAVELAAHAYYRERRLPWRRGHADGCRA